MHRRLNVIQAALCTAIAGAGLVSASPAFAQEPSPGEHAAAVGDWHGAVEAFEAEVAATDAAAAWYQLGVARALAADASGAAEAFRAVRERDPAFPEIDARIAAAEARATRDAEESVDRAGFQSDATAREEARWDALDRGDLLYAGRAAAGLEPASDPRGDVLEHRELGALEEAAVAAVAAVGDSPTEVERYLVAADALRLADSLTEARYFLSLYLELGGDPLAAAPVRRALDAVDNPGAR